MSRDGHFSRPTSGHNAVANVRERQASEGGAFVLHWPDSLDPEAAVTSVGLRVAKKARKSKAPIPNIRG